MKHHTHIPPSSSLEVGFGWLNSLRSSLFPLCHRQKDTCWGIPAALHGHGGHHGAGYASLAQTHEGMGMGEADDGTCFACLEKASKYINKENSCGGAALAELTWTLQMVPEDTMPKGRGGKGSCLVGRLEPCGSAPHCRDTRGHCLGTPVSPLVCSSGSAWFPQELSMLCCQRH